MSRALCVSLITTASSCIQKVIVVRGTRCTSLPFASLRSRSAFVITLSRSMMATAHTSAKA